LDQCNDDSTRGGNPSAGTIGHDAVWFTVCAAGPDCLLRPAERAFALMRMERATGSECPSEFILPQWRCAQSA
jgi:hypothetical protein